MQMYENYLIPPNILTFFFKIKQNSLLSRADYLTKNLTIQIMENKITFMKNVKNCTQQGTPPMYLSLLAVNQSLAKRVFYP